MTNDFNLRILSLDLALANTGFCVFKVNTQNYGFTISDFGTIETDAGSDMDSRLSFLITNLQILINRCDINYVISEYPAMTLFKSHNAGSAGVMKLASAFYYIKGYMDARDIYIRGIQPSQWQKVVSKSTQIERLKNGTKKQYREKYSKALSIQKALKILIYLKVQKKLKAADEHAADAINIGIHCLTKLSSGEWKLPSTVRVYEVSNGNINENESAIKNNELANA